MKHAPRFAAPAALALAVAGCGAKPAAEPKAPAPQTYARPEKAADDPPPAVRYTDVSADWGIRFVHENGMTGDKYVPQTMGSGVCLFDYDGDGDLDMFLVNGRKFVGDKGVDNRQALYRNEGGGHWSEVAKEAGLDQSLYGMGCAVADYDGDGHPDLYLTTAMDGNLLFHSDGRGHFSDVTTRAGLVSPRWKDAKGHEHPVWSTSAAFLDYDRDGYPDLFVCDYIQWSVESDVYTTRAGIGKSFTTPELYQGQSSLLYHNRGDGTFEDVSAKAGIANPEGKSLGVAVADVNADGLPDLVVSNDTQPNYLYVNKGDGTFDSAGLKAGIAYDDLGKARAGMGIDVAAPLADGKPTIAIGNFSREPVSLFHLENTMLFVDAAGRARLSGPTLVVLTFGLAFFDYDLDGHEDLALANGHIEPDIQKVEQEVSYAEPAQLFRNLGGEKFSEVSSAVGADLGKPMVGRGLAYGDLDGDGDLDLVLTANGGAVRVLRNDDSCKLNHWVRFNLVGSKPATDALGAVVTLSAGGRKQSRTVRSGSSYLSQSELTLSFGLGAATTLDQVEVRWPRGTAQTVDPATLGVDRVITLREPPRP